MTILEVKNLNLGFQFEEDFKQADDYLRNLMLNMKAEHKVYLENKKKKRKASKN